MTGQEFLEKVRSINNIQDIHWDVTGDILDPEEVKVVVIADDEKFELEFPRPGTDTFKQYAFIALLINKLMDQLGVDFTTNIGDDMNKSVNFARDQIR